MADYPDVYADGFRINAGPFGLTLTLVRSEPTEESGPHEDPTEIVARVRMSPTFAKAMADSIQQLLASAATQVVQQSSRPQ